MRTGGGKRRLSGFVDTAAHDTVSCSRTSADILRGRGMYFHYVVCTDASNLAPCEEPALGNVPRCYSCLDAVVAKHRTPGLVLKPQRT